MPDDRRKRAKAALASDLPISIRIGRNGITEELVAELSTQVAARGLVKVKLNRGLADREERAAKHSGISQHPPVRICSWRGNVAIYGPA